MDGWIQQAQDFLLDYLLYLFMSSVRPEVDGYAIVALVTTVREVTYGF